MAVNATHVQVPSQGIKVPGDWWWLKVIRTAKRVTEWLDKFQNVLRLPLSRQFYVATGNSGAVLANFEMELCRKSNAVIGPFGLMELLGVIVIQERAYTKLTLNFVFDDLEFHFISEVVVYIIVAIYILGNKNNEVIK